ncbi:hypothetical protein Lalb_Chr02g0150041 [Lupinus albus]|uniref:Uncharacterized protein n=1 Tax=Lupinus albus TaxID=3870 RepID=A0A6A4R094_LUPAL|nr:hypothetical protein Lalb_Chr02g0150041 [Lupinus albus]
MRTKNRHGMCFRGFEKPSKIFVSLSFDSLIRGRLSKVIHFLPSKITLPKK